MSAQFPAQLYSTGPAHVYVALPVISLGAPTGLKTPIYFGTAKISPQIELRAEWEPVFNDLGGKVAFDTAFMGEEALTSIEFTRWVEPVYAQLANRPTPGGGIAGGIRGLTGPLDVGSLMLTEGLNFGLYIIFPFARAKRAYATLPRGYFFPGTFLMGPDKHNQMGTHPKELFLLFHSLRLFNKDTGQLLLYTNDVSACDGIATF